MARSRTRLGIREARLITKELRLLGVPPKIIAKMWAAVVFIPMVAILGYLAINHDAGIEDPTVLSGVQITYVDNYKSHVKNNTRVTLKTLTVRCSQGGDSQPTETTTRLYPPVQPGYGQDAYVSGNCVLIRINESHQLW